LGIGAHLLKIITMKKKHKDVDMAKSETSKTFCQFFVTYYALSLPVNFVIQTNVAPRSPQTTPRTTAAIIAGTRGKEPWSAVKPNFNTAWLVRVSGAPA
jgi:hypothetical protein